MPQHLEVEQELPETSPPLNEFIRSITEQLILYSPIEDSSPLQKTPFQSVILPTSRNTIQNDNSPAQTIQLDSQVTSLTAINLPTNVTTPKNATPPTQTVEPVLGFTPAEIHRAKKEPKLTVKQLLGLSSCKEYVQVPLKMLDGIYVNQPSQFLPLAQEAKKLAKALKQEQDASQWAGIPPNKILQGSFIEQLNATQALEQLAPLHTAREHLP